jgi:hypothetical protein
MDFINFQYIPKKYIDFVMRARRISSSIAVTLDVYSDWSVVFQTHVFLLAQKEGKKESASPESFTQRFIERFDIGRSKSGLSNEKEIRAVREMGRIVQLITIATIDKLKEKYPKVSRANATMYEKRMAHAKELAIRAYSIALNYAFYDPSLIYIIKPYLYKLFSAPPIEVNRAYHLISQEQKELLSLQFRQLLAELDYNLQLSESYSGYTNPDSLKYVKLFEDIYGENALNYANFQFPIAKEEGK